ncbi:hypothetical protein EB796_008154 [Bugula neritina]|uniref:Plastocyanin-like domain-containing protein n=1 Tax=Bugula neritina TaxID=10212 RepID=A0A7J7K6D8_BUGNE|nr:hypothetical protein EB796_008154 [Bugula neritina]
MMNENGKRLVKPKNGQLYDIGDLNTPLGNVSDIIQADGYYQNPRLVIVANNSLPGPTINVTEGQKVKVKVINKLLSEGVTVHWHGVVQKNTNFMDGVSFINQCPISPGSSFTYE